jgi:BirA family biotin operon repressor/biotin-[acetyl-CoA-carboxylase] ligase
MIYHHFQTLPSTNDHLAGMAETGAEEWTVVTADRQTSGRGRGGKAWWSPKGNLHMSILLRPEVDPRKLLRLPVMASAAFLSAMGESGSSLAVKWPNDILFDGRKMVGILVESRSEGDKVLWAVVGFGVNVKRPEGDSPIEIRDRMAFVHEVDEDLDQGDLSERIIRNMKKYSAGLKEDKIWDIARDQWTRKALLNTPYTYCDGGRKLEGIPIRLDVNGGLVMATEDGEITVYSGEIEETAQSPKPKAP